MVRLVLACCSVLALAACTHDWASLEDVLAAGQDAAPPSPDADEPDASAPADDRAARADAGAHAGKRPSFLR